MLGMGVRDGRAVGVQAVVSLAMDMAQLMSFLRDWKAAAFSGTLQT